MKFNREKSKEYKSLKCNNKTKIENFGKITLTSFGVILLLFSMTLTNKVKPIIPNDNKPPIQIILTNSDKSRGKYLDTVSQYQENFDNRELIDFYKNGKIVFQYNNENIEVTVKSLYLRYGENGRNNFVFLANVLNGRNVDLFTKEDKIYAETEHIIEFRNTTLFEQLYNGFKDEIIENKLFLSNEETENFVSTIENWDGRINDMVPQTMAVSEKQVWEADGNERTR